jgi:hypothetical protein
VAGGHLLKSGASRPGEGVAIPKHPSYAILKRTKGASVRIGGFATAVLLIVGMAQSVQAQQVDYSGKWSLSGQIIAGRMFTSFAQICDLKQTGDQIAGPCHGPNGGCSAVGVVNGSNVDLTCRTSFTNAPNLAGVSTFHGSLGADEIVRGSCTHSRFPGATGVFFLMRV